MVTKVVNIKSLQKPWPPGYVYIGRPSVFGNPFPMKSEADRDAVCDMFCEYADGRVAEDEAYRESVRGLYGKVLVCYCHPRRCHGHKLAKLAELLHSEIN